MQTKKIFLPLLAILLVLSVSGFSFAKDKTSDKHEKHMTQMIQELELNQAQAAKLRAIHKNYREKMKSKKEKMSQLSEEMDTMLKDNKSDAAIKAKGKALQSVHQELVALDINKTLEIRSILTKDQLAKYEGFKKMNRGKHGKKKDKHKSHK